MPPTETSNQNSRSLSQKTNKPSIYTSHEEGPDLGELIKLWRDSACSEERLKMMTELKKKKIGFNEIEMFSLGLQYNLKSEQMKDSSNKPKQKVIAAVMDIKMRDEAQHLREMKRKKEMMRKWLERTTFPKTHQYKRMIKKLRIEAETAREISRKKYQNKLNHLEK